MASHEHKYELPMLSGAERDDRWRRVRQEMSQAGLDCLVAYGAPGNLSALYLTQVDMEGLWCWPTSIRDTAATTATRTSA